MTLTIEINIKPEKVRDAKFAVEKLFNDASSRIKRDMDCRRTPTQVEEQHVNHSAPLRRCWVSCGGQCRHERILLEN